MKKPTNAAPEYRQRTLEGEDDGPLRGRIRDADDEREHRIWLRGVIQKFAIWAVGVGTFVVMFRDIILNALKALGK